MNIIRTVAEPLKKPSKLKCFWWKLERKWQNICDFFNPKNEWFYEDIPNHYVENNDLIKIVLYKTLVSYVEVEKGLQHSDWSEGDAPSYKELIEACYEGITVTLPELQKIMDSVHYPWTEDEWRLYSDTSDEFDKTEQLICETIVKIRGVLWT